MRYFFGNRGCNGRETSREVAMAKGKAKKPKFTARPVICVTIVHKSNGLINRFVKFLYDQHIHPAVNDGHGKAGSFCGFFAARDVKKIKAWLREQGAKPEKG